MKTTLCLLALIMAEASSQVITHRVILAGSGRPGEVTPITATLQPQGALKQYAITAFSIPLTSVPLRTWSPKSKDSYTLASSAAPYVEITVELQYVRNSPNDTSTGDIWCYGQYLEMCNNALKSAHEQMLHQVPEIGGCWPRVSFDPATRLFSHWLPLTYDANGIKLFTTYGVARLFANMGGNNPLVVEYPSSGPKQFQITTQGGAPSGGPCHEGTVLTQEFPSLYAWDDLRTVELSYPGGKFTLTDVAALPREGGRAPFEYAGPPIWIQWPWGLGEQIQVEAWCMMADGSRRKLQLNDGDSLRVVFAFA